MFNQTEGQKTAAANAIQHLSESELADVLECARKVSARDAALILTCYSHGMRNQEIARLRLSDINLQDGTIHIERLKGSLNQVQPIGRRPGRPALDEISTLKRWLKERAQSNDPSDFVFVSKKGGALCQRQTNRIFAVYCEQASQARIARGERPIPTTARHIHALKHTAATHAVERGVDVYSVKMLLGHRSLASAERYMHGSMRTAWSKVERARMEAA